MPVLELSESLGGIIPPMVVPFDVEGKLDEESFKKEARYLLDYGIQGISVGGSTGEGAMLTNSEIIRCNELLVECNDKSIPVYGGIIKNATSDVIEVGKALKTIGVDVLLITPVFYHGATERENFEFFRQLSDELRMPIIIYNVVQSNLITPVEFLKISKLDWVIGIKQVEPIKLAELVSLSDNNFRVFAACDQLLFGCYASGACGMISALATVMPEACLLQWNAFRNGDYLKAIKIQKILLPVVMSYFIKPYPSKVKALVNLQGRSGGFSRHPLGVPDNDLLVDMKFQLEKAHSRINALSL
ncbi:dihydrodipicolinate synthase family protein [Membranihabitans maritimus]|uniref:dihydrodipicolinate synthase family protein n=1 Tax=Membranihabitans maritimus TaxID=2904244 RepID=UPI001F162424|nr:dihydrodipicolinate synthase family protein [Membranihabitans maritimus]